MINDQISFTSKSEELCRRIFVIHSFQSSPLYFLTITGPEVSQVKVEARSAHAHNCIPLPYLEAGAGESIMFGLFRIVYASGPFTGVVFTYISSWDCQHMMRG